MNKKIPVSIWLTSIIIAMAVTFSITMTFAMNRFDTVVASVQQKELMYSKISEIDTFVRANDYYDIDETLLQDTIASGYIYGTADVYAKYYTAAAYTEWLAIETGKKMGIGVEAVKDPATGYAKVLSVYAASPAADLGIQVGDYITNVGEYDVKNFVSTAQVQTALLGESGTAVTVAWLNAKMEAQTGDVTRRNYTQTTIAYELVAGNGYIRVRTFGETTASEIDYAVSQLKQQGATAIVFDLRNNNGGDLTYAYEAIDLVCNKGEIASAEQGDGKVEVLFKSYDEGITLPIVCVVNETTSAGAELFAYNARVLNGASIVGSQTGGIGAIQCEPQRFSDGSAVVVTVAKLLACDGTSFDGVGVSVDVERALTAEERQMFYTYTTSTDPQLSKAFAVADSLSGVATVEAVASNDQNPEDQADNAQAGDADASQAGDAAESTEATSSDTTTPDATENDE